MVRMNVLIRRFLNGPNFMPWFQRRRAVAEREQDRLWRHARMKTDMQQLVSKMSELEIVDSFNVIEKLLHRELQVVTYPLMVLKFLFYVFWYFLHMNRCLHLF